MRQNWGKIAENILTAVVGYCSDFYGTAIFSDFFTDFSNFAGFCFDLIDSPAIRWAASSPTCAESLFANLIVGLVPDKQLFVRKRKAETAGNKYVPMSRCPFEKTTCRIAHCCHYENCSTNTWSDPTILLSFDTTVQPTKWVPYNFCLAIQLQQCLHPVSVSKSLFFQYSLS